RVAGKTPSSGLSTLAGFGFSGSILTSSANRPHCLYFLRIRRSKPTSTLIVVPDTPVDLHSTCYFTTLSAVILLSGISPNKLRKGRLRSVSVKGIFSDELPRPFWASFDTSNDAMLCIVGKELKFFVHS